MFALDLFILNIDISTGLHWICLFQTLISVLEFLAAKFWKINNLFVLIYFILTQILAKSYLIFTETVSVNSSHFEFILVLFRICQSHFINILFLQTEFGSVE